MSTSFLNFISCLGDYHKIIMGDPNWSLKDFVLITNAAYDDCRRINLFFSLLFRGYDLDLKRFDESRCTSLWGMRSDAGFFKEFFDRYVVPH